MFKRLARSPMIPWIGGTVLWAYMSILSHTLRWRVEGLERLRSVWAGAPQGWVLASWHSRILLMPMLQIIYRPKWPKPPHPMSLMVSPSKDGEFTRRSGLWLGLHIIRGSASGRTDKSKRGVTAAREAMEIMKKGGGIVITLDGPKGPKEVVGMGAIKLAQQMGAPIYIYGLSASAKRLSTWDRLLWPNPFARAAMVVPEPIQTSKDMNSEDLRRRVEIALKAATARADELCGLAPDLESAKPIETAARAASPEVHEPAVKKVTPTAIEHRGT